MKLVLIPLCLSLLAVPAFAAEPAKKEAAPAAAAAPITNASEAAMIYRRLCVETGGDMAKTETVLKGFIEGGVAKKVTKDQSKQMTGHDSLATWVMQSPATKQKLMVDYDSKRTCSVYVNRASKGDLRQAFRNVVGFTASSVKGKVAMKSQTKEIGGNPIDLDFFEVIPPGDQPRIALMLSSSDKPVGDTQHYMTYSILPAKKK